MQDVAEVGAVYSYPSRPRDYAASFPDFLPQNPKEISIANYDRLRFTVTLCSVVDKDPFQSERSTEYLVAIGDH